MVQLDGGGGGDSGGGTADPTMGDEWWRGLHRNRKRNNSWVRSDPLLSRLPGSEHLTTFLASTESLALSCERRSPA